MEAKALGFRMGDPAFLVRKELERHRVAVYSSNYTLYGDLSARIMNTLHSFSEEVEVYSIDEAFLSLSATAATSWDTCAGAIRRTVNQHVGIPTSIGVAPTKTLAKIANHVAKRNPTYQTQGVFVLQEQDTPEVLAQFKIENVWGIGRRYAHWLTSEGITTAGKFCNLPEYYVRARMSVVGQRLWRELRGEPCLNLELVSGRRKNICTSRTFSLYLYILNLLVQWMKSTRVTVRIPFGWE